MRYNNEKVEKILEHISIDSFLKVINTAILLLGDGTKIERHPLETILCYEIPRIKITDRLKPMTKDQASDVIQEFIFQSYLTMSDNNPNPKSELYFEFTEKTRKILDRSYW
ncbi:MAG: hypothetical protein NT139_00065 [Candidatus Woesearchaeota archaeon]|nr:hypothetical protein [Candidatus Woesearchaeota archaeon]